MNESSQRMNLRQNQDQQSEQIQRTGSASDVLEFQSAEEMLRHDAAQIEIPPGIAEKVAVSARDLTPVPWWKRLFHPGSS